LRLGVALLEVACAVELLQEELARFAIAVDASRSEYVRASRSDWKALTASQRAPRAASACRRARSSMTRPSASVSFLCVASVAVPNTAGTIAGGGT